VELKLPVFLTAEVGEDEWSGTRYGRFTRFTHCIGGWVDSTAGLDVIAECKLPCPAWN